MPGGAAFLAAHPCLDGLDELRATEYARLDASGNVYLDYTGGGLYAESQLARAPARCCATSVFGNPHSANPTSAAATALVEQARAAVLALLPRLAERVRLRSSPPNATGALRLVGEAYPFAPATASCSPSDNHNSVNGIREFARARGRRDRLRAARAARAARRRARAARATSTTPPAAPQPVRLPRAVELLRRQAPARVDRRGARAGLGRAARRRRVRADQPARPVGAGTPDFVALSFYKMFGYPTGVGALLARRDALAAPASGPGSAAARSSPRSCRATWTSAARRPRPASRTAPSTTSASRRSRSACATSSGSASTRSTQRVEALGAPAARASCGALRHADGAPGGPHLRPGDVGPAAARHDRVQLPAPGRARRRRALRRPRRAPRTASRCARAASATRAPARSRSRSRARRWPAPSSARA